jgi:maltoporin
MPRPFALLSSSPSILVASLALLLAATPAAADDWINFSFGSYGRIMAASDLRGGSGVQTNVVSHGPRLEQDSYAELEFRTVLGRPSGPRARVVATLAMNADLFHYTGEFTSRFGIRNLYAESEDVFLPGLQLWAGSRMYRGDDIYLLDYWPLDNLNTLGGGVIYVGERFEVGVQVGVNRLDDPFQYELVEVPAPTFGSREYAFLDRQRTVASLRGIYYFRPLAPGVRLKLKLYAEGHYLPAGIYRNQQDHTEEQLPRDGGWVVGAQLGLWNFGPNSFANFFLRVGGGLGAFDPFAVPYGLDQNKQALAARDVVFAVSANYERRWLGAQVGGYLRYFHDAQDMSYNRNNFWEYVLDVRPYIFVGKYFRQAFDLSFQRRVPQGLDPESGEQETPQVIKLAVMPTVAPLGGGNYGRPELRVIYSLSIRNHGARMLYAKEDPRRGQELEHFLGIGAEWWFNSSYR